MVAGHRRMQQNGCLLAEAIAQMQGALKQRMPSAD